MTFNVSTNNSLFIIDAISSKPDFYHYFEHRSCKLSQTSIFPETSRVLEHFQALSTYEYLS